MASHLLQRASFSEGQREQACLLTYHAFVETKKTYTSDLVKYIYLRHVLVITHGLVLDLALALTQYRSVVELVQDLDLFFSGCVLL